ncbi:MAG: mechanosensitive ion channel family protein [Candidatus Cloacimonetes bacterium]|jgi:small-conductance mechanosensitive channel|nr:mechanosensitive ion channel family protein [Candidatus Cloacimonadota bacterium]MDD3143814.1 mechanosensitive ion channel family protein [Candidatus Cloacimonadota bacterium]MDY0366015.1 mechanosensitive ion channel family protein [Candidatus Syntrophosphaera sp.]HOY85422.1 mechanosensitive ion channel family protein [Candidatus Syntrophosphaera sp.]
MDITNIFSQYVTPERVNVVLRVLLTLAIGIPLIILLKKLTQRIVTNRFSPQSEQLIVRFVYYLSLLILLVSVLNEFGFKLSALLGAAGVVGIAIGFASQTSVSNIISGIFLISEKPFVVGDVIEVAGIRGTIETIDLLSLKLKTPDNQFVRVPNETMIKSEVTNLTRYPLRRINIKVGVAYKEDLSRVSQLLAEIAAAEPLALKDPPPVIMVENFGDSSIDFLFGVWGRTDEFFDLKTSLMIRIKDTFDANHIEIPFPHVSLYAGETSKPLKISNEGSANT